jgi:hypothetical protein
MTDAYRNRTCRKCKSEDFDYGSWREYDAQGKEIIHDYEQAQFGGFLAGPSQQHGAAS